MSVQYGPAGLSNIQHQHCILLLCTHLGFKYGALYVYI